MLNPLLLRVLKIGLQIDLIDLQDYKQFNNGYAYILTTINCFSKYANIEPLKNRGAKTIADAFEKIILRTEPKNRTKIVQADNEFKTKEFEKLAQKYNFKMLFSTPYKPNTNGMIERFNRTLKNLIFKYLTANKTKFYIDAINDLVTNYNNSYHSTIKLTPSQAENKENKEIVEDRIQYHVDFETTKPDFKLRKGSKVRIDQNFYSDYVKNKLFNKKFKPTFTTKVYTIVSGGPLEYKLSDEEGIQLNYSVNVRYLLPVKEVIETLKNEKEYENKHFNREEHLKKLHQQRRDYKNN